MNLAAPTAQAGFRMKVTVERAELLKSLSHMHRVVEPGTFKVLIGGNSVDLIETTLTAK